MTEIKNSDAKFVMVGVLGMLTIAGLGLFFIYKNDIQLLKTVLWLIIIAGLLGELWLGSQTLLAERDPATKVESK